jgi:phosphoribosylanthranilate isomerase
LRTRVKICGITNLNDACNAVAAGADALGLVFYAASPRHVSIAQASQIAQAVPAFVTCVGLFVDATAEQVREVIAQVPLQLLQFHGNETAEFCQQFNLPYIKAIRVHNGANLLQYVNQFQSARALLLDAYVEGVPGGTGQKFDWDLIPSDLAKPIILAGGLDADNIRHAIHTVKPYAVDVSGGVEQSKGVKCKHKMAAFMQGVSNATL